MIKWIEEILKNMSGLKVGEVDIGDQVLDNEYKIKVLLKLVQKIMDKNPAISISQEELNQILNESVSEMQQKYPKSDLKISK